MNSLFIDTSTKYLCIGIAKDNNVIYIKFDPDIKYQDIDNNGNKVLNGNNKYELYNYIVASANSLVFLLCTSNSAS